MLGGRSGSGRRLSRQSFLFGLLCIEPRLFGCGLLRRKAFLLGLLGLLGRQTLALLTIRLEPFLFGALRLQPRRFCRGRLGGVAFLLGLLGIDSSLLSRSGLGGPSLALELLGGLALLLGRAAWPLLLGALRLES